MKFHSAKNFVAILFCVGLFLWSPSVAIAFSSLEVKVEVIKADRNSKVVDPQLKDLVKELSPVLKYSGFSLLKKSEISLKSGEKGEVILSSGRLLELRFLGFEDKKAKLTVKILEKGRETFRTTLLLINKGSILIGGPPHEDGVLLLRITGQFK